MSNATSGKMLWKAFTFILVLFIISCANLYSQEITPLDSIKTNDNLGISTWVGTIVNVTGIVTSTIECGTGTSGPGTIQNSNTAVSIYGGYFASTGGVSIGDSVVVTNVQVQNYYGLTELGYIPSQQDVQVISHNHKVLPTEVTAKTMSQGWDGFEKYESMLVQFNNVTFPDTETTFYLNRTSSKGTPYGKYYFIDGTDTVTFYFTKNCTSLLGKPVPKVSVNVVGILSQSWSTAPYNDGYELVPIDSSAIRTITAVNTKINKDYSYNLYQNYPNPFNPTTTISFSVPFSEKVELSVYDLLGRKVATLYNDIAPAGITRVDFKANNLASGIYIYTIKTKNGIISKKLELLK